MRPQLLYRKTHKWLGLILGVQVLLWFISGFLMSWMPIAEIRGDHLLKPVKSSAISLDRMDLGLLSKQVKQPILSATVKPWLGQTVVEVKTKEQTMMFDTPELNLITPITEATVRQVLNQQLLADLEIEFIVRLTEVPDEARGRTAPLWQVQLKGGEDARIYVSEQTGEIVAKRTNRWRLFDFVWMLHIMDYDERVDFNHPLLYLTALSACLFTLSGFVMLFYSFRRRPKKTS